MVALVAPYSVIVIGRLCHISLNLADFTTTKAEYDELRERVLGLKIEKHKFEEHYDLFPRE